MGTGPGISSVLLAATMLPAAIVAGAGEIEHTSVRKDGNAYVTDAAFMVAAPAAAVVALMTDYERVDELNPQVTECVVMSQRGDKARVRSRYRDCVAFFCLDLDVVQDMELTPEGVLEAVIVPNEDLHGGHSRWTFEALGGQTRVVYRSRLEPGVFIPPLIGPRVMRRRLRAQMHATAEAVERLVTTERLVARNGPRVD